MPPLSKEHLFLAFIVNAIIGAACVHFSKKKGRYDPTGWFLLGFLFGVFALAVLLLLPTKEQMQLATEAEAAKAKARDNPSLALPPPVLTTTLEKRDWFYLDEKHAQQGPIDLTLLKEHCKSGQITDSTLMWSEGMLDWKQLKELSYLQTELE